MKRRNKIAGFCTTIQEQPRILGGLTAKARLARPKFNSLVRAACMFFNIEYLEREVLDDFFEEARTVQNAREEDDALYNILGLWARVAEPFDTGVN